MKRLLIALSLVAVAASPAFAQQILPPYMPPIPTLTAEGEGVARAVPDILIINIGVVSRGETPAAALEANTRDMRAVLDVVAAAGIAERDVQTSNFTISPVYSNQRPADPNAGPRIIAYEVTNQVTIRIREVATSGRILDDVVAAGANRINSIRFDIDDPQPLRDEAMQAAIADARRKAELMAAAAGVRIVRVLSVSTYADARPQMDTMAFARAEAVPIAPGENVITVRAAVTFEIESAE
jgi:uncharacterized protein